MDADVSASTFGLPRARPAAEEEDRFEHFGIVASVRETVPNSYIITLEDGQVWRQTRPSWYPLQAGHRVRIYASGWGKSYRMSSETLKGFIQVERVR